MTLRILIMIETGFAVISSFAETFHGLKTGARVFGEASNPSFRVH